MGKEDQTASHARPWSAGEAISYHIGMLNEPLWVGDREHLKREQGRGEAGIRTSGILYTAVGEPNLDLDIFGVR